MFFVYDSEDGVSFFETIEAAHVEVERRIDACRDSDGTWGYGVDDICLGQILERVVETNREGDTCDYALRSC